jgi:hypothetical protein
MFMNRVVKHLIVAIVAVVAGVGSAMAQDISTMRSLLEMRSLSGTKISIVEDQSTQEAIMAVESVESNGAVLGYRVVLFYDNAQYAQDRAQSVLEQFNKEYPEINAYLVYEKPYFKVSVGDCITSEEALILRNKIIRSYPGAFTRRDNIKYSELGNVRRRVDCLQLDPLVRDSLLYYREFRDELRKDETMFIVMQRDSALFHMLYLDELARNMEGQSKRRASSKDPEWVTEW